MHPGKMGVTVAAAVTAAGNDAFWTSEGRSAATAERATAAGISDAGSLADLCTKCEMIFSICPPDRAIDVAQSVADQGFKGVFVDCNAVSPATANATAKIIASSGASFVDAGIIGPPPTKPGSTRLYVSGDGAQNIPPLFEGSLIESRFVNKKIGAASALKMSYAGWSKGSTALLMTQVALARAEGVEEALFDEMALSLPGIREKLAKGSVTASPKAWRFVGEMEEIARTLDDAGLPGEWFVGAADTYSRLAGFKDQTGVPEGDIIQALLKKPD